VPVAVRRRSGVSWLLAALLLKSHEFAAGPPAVDGIGRIDMRAALWWRPEQRSCAAAEPMAAP
jgi:hypothetical protein